MAGVAAALSGAEPVGTTGFDSFWSALFAVTVVLGASRSRRLPTTWMAGIAGVVAVGGGTLAIVLGVLSLLGAAVIAFTGARERVLGALVGLVASQALLRGATYGPDGLPTIVAAIAVVPVLVSAWRVARRRERRVVAITAGVIGALVLLVTAAAGVAAIQARPHLTAAADRAETALDQLRDGQTVAAADELAKAEIEFDNASSSLDGPLGLAGRAVPVVGQHLEALRRVSSSGGNLASAASQAASTADWGELSAASGDVDVVRMQAMQQPVAESSAAIAEALATVADVRSPWLLGPVNDELDRFEDKLADASDEASLAAEGLRVAPGMLGADGPRRYLVTFATPGESRNAGGFAGAFAVVEADGGTLRVTRTGSTMADLPLDADSPPLDLPAEWESRYGSYDVARFPGNVTAGPDWPTDAQVAAEVYERSPGGGPIDGVVYADPAAMAALLQLTGPLDVPGVREPLSADNAEQYLLIDQYVQYADAGDTRRDVLQDVAKVVFDALLDKDLPGIRTLEDVLGPAVAEGHLRIVSLAERRGAGLPRSRRRERGVGGDRGRRPGVDPFGEPRPEQDRLLAAAPDRHRHLVRPGIGPGLFHRDRRAAQRRPVGGLPGLPHRELLRSPEGHQPPAALPLQPARSGVGRARRRTLGRAEPDRARDPRLRRSRRHPPGWRSDAHLPIGRRHRTGTDLPADRAAPAPGQRRTICGSRWLSPAARMPPGRSTRARSSNPSI